MCRSITTSQNDSDQVLPQDVITENIDSAVNYTNITEPATSSAIVETTLKIGDFKAMGLANFTPVGLIEEFFEILHVTTGLPWWGTITIATLILRLGLFPLVIKGQNDVAKLTAIQPKCQKLLEQIKKAREDGDQITVMNKTLELQQLYSDNNINMFSSFIVPLVQMPFFISFFMALRKMSELPVPGFDQGGLLWFKDLSVPDPQVILPVLVSAGFILMLEFASESTGNLKSSQGSGIKWFFRVVSITSLYFTMQLPSSVVYYFFCANTLAFAQNQLIRNQKVRSYFGLPPIVKPKMDELVKKKGLMEQWKDWNAAAATETKKNTNKKRKPRR